MTDNTIRAHRAQQNTCAQNPETLTSTIENPRKFDRDLWRLLNPGKSSIAINSDADVLSVFFGPSQGIGRGCRKEVERMAKTLSNPHIFPSQIEIEFSASPEDAFPPAEGLPEDYRQLAVDWAFGLSSAIVLAVNSAARGALEPYVILRPVQTVVRCSEETADIWIDYLGRRIRPRHRFAVVRFASEVRA